MKISSQLSKLALVTYALVGIGVLGWSGVGVGDDYNYTLAGDAYQNGQGQFPYTLTNSQPTSNEAGNSGKSKSEQPQMLIPEEPLGSGDTNSQQAAQSNSSEKPGVGNLCSLACTSNADCACASEATGKEYTCCTPENGIDPGQGSCVLKGQCKQNDNDGPSDNNPNNPSGNNPPNQPNQCASDDDCKNAGLPGECNLGDRACDKNMDNGASLCVCRGWTPGYCLDHNDCAKWYDNGMSGKCSNIKWYRCHKENPARDNSGICRCEPPASCENKPNGEPCSECKHPSGGSCAEKGGTCSCMLNRCECMFSEA